MKYSYSQELHVLTSEKIVRSLLASDKGTSLEALMAVVRAVAHLHARHRLPIHLRTFD